MEPPGFICEHPYEPRAKRARMRTYIALVLVAVLGACDRTSTPNPTPPPTAQAKTPPPAPVAKDDPWAPVEVPKPKDPLPHPFFWSAEKDGKTTYFLGTFHVGIDPETRLPDYVWKKLDDSPTFAMETDLSGVDLDTARHDGHTLHADLGDAYWHKLEDAMTPPVAKRLDPMKPMVAAMMLQMKDIPKTPPMDGMLLGHAMNAKKGIVYLEPAEKQAKLLDKYMDTRTLKMELDHLADAKKLTDEFVAAYVAGDADKMTKLTDAERAEAKSAGFTDAEIDQENEDMLYARNASWIEPLLAMHAKGGGFVAVGAAHLIGKRSVLELLAAKGFKITRLPPPAT